MVGGNDGAGGTSCELYDPASGSWAYTGYISELRTNQSATRLADGKVLLVGSYTGRAELYDPAGGSWAPGGTPGVKDNQSVLLDNGKVLVVGINLTYTAYVTTIYDPATGAWTPAAPFPVPNEPLTMVCLAKLPSGNILAASARNGSHACRLFDPSTGLWSFTGPRYYMARGAAFPLTSLPDGKVLASGIVSILETELYDPIAGTWSLTGSFSVNHAGGTCTLLADGRALSAGGYASAGACDLYTIDPTAPTGLEAAAPSHDVNLSWNANSPAEHLTNYRIFRRYGTMGPFLPLADVPASTTTYRDIGATAPSPSSHVWYKVSAVSPVAESGQSTETQAVPQADLDGDRDVDVVDFSMFAALFGTSNPSADFDDNGRVDVIDFAVFAAWYGWTY